jgi:hypothetical protein
VSRVEPLAWVADSIADESYGHCVNSTKSMSTRRRPKLKRVASGFRRRRRHAGAREWKYRGRVTCRVGPRPSAVVYLYAGLRAGASADEVLARADADAAPFVGLDDLRAFVTQGLSELATEG